MTNKVLMWKKSVINLYIAFSGQLEPANQRGMNMLSHVETVVPCLWFGWTVVHGHRWITVSKCTIIVTLHGRWMSRCCGLLNVILMEFKRWKNLMGFGPNVEICSTATPVGQTMDQKPWSSRDLSQKHSTKLSMSSLIWFLFISIAHSSCN